MIYDYADINIAMFERMYKRRLKAYAKLGYTLAVGTTADSRASTQVGASRSVGDVGGVGGVDRVSGGTSINRHVDQALVFGDDYAALLRDDIAAAQQSVTISTTRITKSGIAQIERQLTDAIKREVAVNITVRLRDEASQSAQKRMHHTCQQLRQLGCEVKVAEWCLDCAILDQRLVWYGGIPLLGNAPDATDECSLRTLDSQAAALLTDSQRQGLRPLVG